ncbi:THUMP domain-containing class I SAM-dependent RNA methyltransferase [Ezakiella peruensis]|uniref:THUMP domain-containing class I SAM-dependent RNA methyltransferase n=1 Tax=Ezakiella peruensis TaxID=1464038 RepID=UPI00147399B5|nr:class I SAM-dependent RNA methyltransferase [Ezakiella peruensis]
MEYTLTATCHFGVEAVLKREITDLGLKIKSTTDGRVEFFGQAEDIFRANLFLRTAERVFVNLIEFEALTFEDLYQGIFAFPWADLLEEDANFIINGRSYKSKLFSISDCQRVTERAIIDKLNLSYNKSYYEKTGKIYSFEISMLNDQATLYLNTSGPGLHKRGYRKKQGAAPIKETLASAMIQLSVWNPDRELLDPFTGSGTIPIEAAMIAKNIPSGILRRFDCEHFSFMNEVDFKAIRDQAFSNINQDRQINIKGSDYDRNMIMTARENAASLKLDDIFFFTKEVRKIEDLGEYGVIITNPPYGIRLSDETLDRTYENFNSFIESIPTWSIYMITDYDIKDVINREINKNRKLYNGKIKTYFYTMLGPRPPREDHV